MNKVYVDANEKYLAKVEAYLIDHGSGYFLCEDVNGEVPFNADEAYELAKKGLLMLVLPGYSESSPAVYAVPVYASWNKSETDGLHFYFYNGANIESASVEYTPAEG